MSFVKTVWADRVLPKLTAAQLNRIEQAIDDLYNSGASQDAWHEFNATGEPLLTNSWTNKGGSYETAAYRFVLPKVVALKGTITGGTTVSQAIIDRAIPAAYRPSKERRIPAIIADGGGNSFPGQLVIYPSGFINIYSLSGATANPIDEFSFEGMYAL